MDGGSIGGTLFILFLILKLVGVITWSWWWVTAPLWIDAGLSVIVLGIFALLGISFYPKIKKFVHEEIEF